MNDTLKEAIKEAYACSPSDEVELDTLQFSHPDIPETIYLVNDRVGHSLTLEGGQVRDFMGAPFRMIPPQSGESGAQDISLSIDNTDQRISDFLNTVKESLVPVEVTWRIFLASDTSGPQNDPPLILHLRDVVVKSAEVTGKATFVDIINKKFLTDFYTRDGFPSLAN